MPKPFSLISLISLCSLISGCVWMTPANKRVAKAKSKIEEGYTQEAKQQASKMEGGAFTADWKTATSMMFRSNPNLIQADYRVHDSRENGKRIFTNMIPSVSLGASDSFLASDIGAAFTDPNYRISSFLSLGNLLQLPTRLYTAKLYTIGAQFQAEQAMRQEVIGLYRIFQEKRLLDTAKKSLDIQAQIISIIGGADAVQQATMKLQLDRDLKSWHDKELVWRQKVGDFYMTSFSEINLSEKNIPNITYDPAELDFTDSTRWGSLQMSLLAMQKIAEDGQVLDAYLRYLPTTNLAVSAPPLYSNTGQPFDVGLTRFSPSLNWQLDTRGFVGDQIDRLRRNEPLKNWRDDKRRRDEVSKLIEGRKALAEVQQELVKVRAVMEQYKIMVKTGLIDDSRTAVEKMKQLRTLEIQYMAKEIDICSSFWLIDENRWLQFSRQWQQTRPIRMKYYEKNQQRGFLDFLKNR